MAFPLDPPVLRALDALEAGDSEPLAELFESGECLETLHKFLTPSHRRMIARSLRKGSVRGQGPRPQDNLTRNRDIAIIVAYWEGYGAPGWSGDAQLNSSFHRTKKELERYGYYMEAGSIRNIFRRYKPDKVARLYMPDAFLDGAERGLGESEDKQSFMRQAIMRHTKLKLEDTESWQRFIQLHSNSQK